MTTLITFKLLFVIFDISKQKIVQILCLMYCLQIVKVI